MVFWKAFICITLLLVGCKNADKNKNGLEGNTSNESAISDGQYCFQNEYPYQNSPSKNDVLELNLEIKGNNVSGVYNWLPAEKDQRKGSLNGTIEDKTITAQYKYMQEGTEHTVEMKILLMEGKAQVLGGQPELGLNTTIDQIECVG